MMKRLTIPCGHQDPPAAAAAGCPLCALYLRCGEYQAAWGGPRVPEGAVQVVVTADGLGDHVLALTSCQGLRNQGRHAVLVAKPHIRPWMELLDGYDTLASAPLPGLPELRPHDTYARQLAERTRIPRWEYYAQACGTTAALPPEKPLPVDALDWARRYAGVVCLAPWSAWGDRTWPLPHWLDLEALLRQRGYRVMILDADSSRGEVFAGELLAGQPPELVAAVVRGAAAVVGNDSGMVHLAGALDTKAVALCGLIGGASVYGIYPSANWIDGPLSCTGCHWGGEARRARGCQTGQTCPSLGAITPAEVLVEVETITCRAAWDRTLLDAGKLTALARAVRATGNLPGDLAELGVYRGGSAAVMHDAGAGKVLRLFDTFAGLPTNDSGGGAHRRGEFACPLDQVRSYLGDNGVSYRPGRFPRSARGLERTRYCCVHLDADLYESTRDALAWFWPRLVLGGKIVLDDFDWPLTPGVKRAVEEAGLLARLELAAQYQGILTKGVL